MFTAPVELPKESGHARGRRLTKPYARQSVLLHRWRNGDRVAMHADYRYCAECGARSISHRSYDGLTLCRDCYEAIRAADHAYIESAIAEFAGEEN